ncbi:MAG: HPr(Ser) kinase/phosphatase [Acidobacteriota bacterium]
MATPDLHTTVRRLFESGGPRLNLTLLSGERGMENAITSPRIQKLGLALAGYIDYLHKGRVQLIGGTEINYLKTLDSSERKQSVQRIFTRELCCIILTKGLEPPTDLLESCRQQGVPLLQTSALSSAAISEVTSFLEEELAPNVTIHGVFVEVFGMGVLMLGDSGIGKSECALDLIRRGHRLVSDDVVIIKKYGPGRLIGSAPAELKVHMELRGLGIINIKELFGISSLSSKKTIDLAIEMVRWKPQEEYDRLGLEEREYSLLDVAVPLIKMPVASGRNLATLVEVAVRIRMLKSQGYDPSREFIRKHGDRLTVRLPK